MNDKTIQDTLSLHNFLKESKFICFVLLFHYFICSLAFCSFRIVLKRNRLLQKYHVVGNCRTLTVIMITYLLLVPSACDVECLNIYIYYYIGPTPTGSTVLKTFSEGTKLQQSIG